MYNICSWWKKPKQLDSFVYYKLFHALLQSSDVDKGMTKQGKESEISRSSTGPRRKSESELTKSGLVKQLGLSVPTMCKKLVPLVEGGELRLEHDGELLHKAQPTGVGAGVVAGQPGQSSPLQGVLSALVFQLPDMTRQAGFYPLLTVAKVGLVVSIADLPGRGSDPRVGLVRLALLHQGGLVQDRGVLAPGAVHGAHGRPTTAVAVTVERPLDRQIVAAACHHLCVVPRYNLGQRWHRTVGELDRVAVQDSPEAVADREALVQD